MPARLKEKKKQRRKWPLLPADLDTKRGSDPCVAKPSSLSLGFWEFIDLLPSSP